MTIRWERQFDDGWFAYSGPTWRSNIGMVVPRDDGTVAWQIDAVSMSRIGKGYGETRSVRTAKLALERNWNKWLKTFNLS
jgi:hypothetical protein